MKMIIFALLLAAVPGYMIFPDVKTISGRVTDSSGSPVTGAIIMVKGQSTATSTDSTGYFSLTIPDDTKIIVISAVGFDTKEIKITSSNDPLKIILNDTIKELQEVVVMGYSSKIVRSLQGSASGVIIRGSRSTKANRKNKHLPYTSNHLPQPDFNTEDYDNIVENRFLKTSVNPLSTFSIDVDGASYSNVRRFLQNGQLPPAGAVRVEELINYFHYDYPQPKDDAPFSINTEMAECPWNNKNKLVMIGLQGRKISVDNLPASNIVFLIDVSGSMEDENKLPLVKSSIKLLIEQLREEDRVSMVVYAGNAGLVLPSTSGAQKQKIRDAVDRLEAGGSTAGGAGIQLAYKVARENFLKQGNNRVILCTDGDFNVGVSSDASLVQLIEKERQ